MWHDNETDCDFVNFESIASTVSEIIVQSKGEPVSIGVSGAWGVGKSSMVKLIKKDLVSRQKDSQPFIFVEFNSWLYQGYDDARAALLDAIAEALRKEAEGNENALKLITKFLGKINWIRMAGIGAQTALLAHFGLPQIGMLGKVVEACNNLISGNKTKESSETLVSAGKEVDKQVKESVLPDKLESPSKEIQELRDLFEKSLKEIKKTLVVFIDDLDRCLPNTTISTLEAIRLFLFLKQTAFVIAADSDVIRLAVQKHFSNTEDKKLITSYFDKLIQIPIQVPPLGTQEVRAYLIMLHIFHDLKEEKDKESIRLLICEHLSKSWEGKRIDLKILEKYKDKIDSSVKNKIEASMRLAHLLTTSKDIAGNPRLIKRFLNAISIREKVAKAQNISIDTKVLSKLLLLERCGANGKYAELVSKIMSDDEGKPKFLKDWEDFVMGQGGSDIPNDWDPPFMKEWLALPPQLADTDLRKELYVSRESAAFVTLQDRLTSNGSDLLTALLENPSAARSIIEELKKLPKSDLIIIVEKILDKAARESKWGTPAILDAILVCAELDPNQTSKISNFFKERPANSIDASLIPRISDCDWLKSVLDTWEQDEKTSLTVKKAIKNGREQYGDITKQ